MATAKKLPSGMWNARAYYKDSVTGKVSRPSFTAGTKSEALRMAHEWESSHEKHFDASDITVADALEQYITLKTAALSPSTIAGYRQMQRNYYSTIETRKISDLTDSDMQMFVSTICKGHSPKTVRNIYALLSSSINMFSKRQFSATLPALVPQQYHLPTDADLKEILQIASPQMRLAISLAAVGTLRAGEICALYFSDVDYEQSGVWVKRDMVKDEHNNWIIKEMPKTASSFRFVPLPETVMDMIGQGDSNDRIIPLVPRSLLPPFKLLCNKVGVNCRFHDLRHYAASTMHALGVPDQYIMERGGWKSDTVLKAVYRNTLSDRSKQFANMTNSHFETLF